MSRYAAETPVSKVHECLVEKLNRHRPLSPADSAALARLKPRVHVLSRRADIVRQGDHPDTAVFVMDGMLGRYHTLAGGDRQYLSFHVAGDLPDIQSLFLTTMDHSLCAMDKAKIALLPHEQLIEIMRRRPTVCFAFWRLTLADAAIFRQAITNLGSRTAIARVAHFFCEQTQRARQSGLSDGNSCHLPLSQEELGQALGLSVVSVNRTMQVLRRQGLVEFRGQRLTIKNWGRLAAVGGFDPSYLYDAE